MSSETNEERILRIFREKMSKMTPDELQMKLDAIDIPSEPDMPDIISFDYTIKGNNIIRVDMDLLKEHGITWDDTVQVILIKNKNFRKMPNLFDLCQNTEYLEKLQKIVDDIHEKERAEIVRQHRKSHIFDSYEDALDWLVKNPDRSIRWHIKTLTYLPEENLFRSYEQEYSFDGVIPYDVRRKYTSEEPLEQHYDILKERGWDLEKDLKDEYGKLDYVYALDVWDD